MFRSFFITAAAVSLAAPAASATPQSWKIDPDHSNFYFTIDHIYSKVRGFFGDYTGEVVFDPADLAASRLYLVVQTASITTGIDARDEHLKSADFFDAAKYPTMEFTSANISLKNGLYQAEGEALVKGKKYPLTIPFAYFEPKEHPMVEGSRVIGLNAELSIDRLLYGIGDEKMLGVVGQKVDVLITLELLDK
ncbi:MAG: polyisoprenoid-binding protein [Desulfobulbaceae bacterium]|nr:polyisoprenoid-binding protein [Desulfobulbaceae bacterium]